MDGEWCSEITMPAIHQAPSRSLKRTEALVGA
jgi:hypothetical protein